MKELADIERHIHNNIHYSNISNSNLTLSHCKNAWFITVKSTKSFGGRAVQDFIKRLPCWIGHFSYVENKHTFALIETPQQQEEFLELQASIIGEALIEHQKETLRIKGEFAESLKALTSFKKKKKITKLKIQNLQRNNCGLII